MARTYRRKQDSYEYRWVLRDWYPGKPFGNWIKLDPRSPAGRKALARFHADKKATMN